MRFEITLPPTVVCALSLDDPCMQDAIDVQYVRANRARWTFSVTRQSSHTVLGEVESRADFDGNQGWDQPAPWKAACRRTLSALRAQVSAGIED